VDLIGQNETYLPVPAWSRGLTSDVDTDLVESASFRWTRMRIQIGIYLGPADPDPYPFQPKVKLNAKQYFSKKISSYSPKY
jgi:hypothetical protein